jgi:hypothetical protein
MYKYEQKMRSFIFLLYKQLATWQSGLPPDCSKTRAIPPFALARRLLRSRRAGLWAMKVWGGVELILTMIVSWLQFFQSSISMNPIQHGGIIVTRESSWWDCNNIVYYCYLDD